MRLRKEKEEMEKAINLLEELSRSREERAIAGEREKARLDELSFRKAALEKGLREGREEGIKQEKLNTAKKLLQKGMTLSEVAEITGLSPAEIEGIR